MLRNCDMTVESAAVELPPLTIAQIQRAQATFEEMHVSPHEREYTCPNSKCEFPTIKTKQYTGNKYFCWQCLKPVHSFCGHVYEKHEQSSARVCFSCIPDNSSDIPTDISPLPYEKATTFRIFEPKPSSNAVTTSQQLEEGEGSLRDVLNSPGFQTLNEADDPDLMDQCREDVEDFNHKVHDPEYLQVGETEDEEFETSEDDTDPDTEDTEAENYVDLTDEDRWYEGIENLGEEEKEILREQRLQELKNSFYDDYETVRRDKGKSTQFYERLKFTRFCQKRKFADVYVTEFKLAAYCKDLEEHRVQRKIGEKVVFELYSYSSIKKAVFAVVRWWKQQSNTVEAMANSPNPYTHAIQTFMQNYMYKDMKRRATSKTLDIIRNTILDSRLTDDEINRILFTCMDKRQFPSVTRDCFTWIYLNITGNRSDDLRAMRMIQFLPYTLRSPDRTEIDYAVLAIMLESKWMKDITKPKHSVFIPHRDPITCPVFWMLLHLHMILDYYKSAVTDKINWLDNETFYGIKILFGRDPEKAIKGESQSKQFNRIFEIANVVSTKKLHGGRVGQAQKLEEKGVDQGQIARGLHWATNIMNGHYLHSVPFEQVTASAGYGRNEKYYPLHLDGAYVPTRILEKAFPFVDSALTELEKKKPAESRGTMLFLQMLRDYRPILFICGAIIFKKTNQAEKNPKSVIFSKLPFWDNEVQKWAEEEYLPWYQAKMAEPVDDVQINDEAVKKGFTKLNDQLRCLRSELNQGLNDIREGQRKQQEMLELLLGRVGFTFNGVTTAGQAEFCEDSPFPQHRRPQIYSPLAATPSNTNKYRSPYQSPSASRQPYRPMSKSKLNFQVDDRGIPIVQKSPSSSPGTFNFTPNITPRRRKNQPSPQPSVTSTAEGGVTQPPLSSASTASNSPLPSAEEGVIIHGVVESPSPEDKSSMTREKVHQTLSSIQTATSKKMPPAKIYMAYDTLPMNLISSFAADSGWDVILNPKFVANKDMLWESYGPPPFSSMQDADFRYLWGVWKNGRQFEEMRKGKKVILQGPSIRWLEETFGPSWRVGNSRSKYFKRFATILEHMEVVRKYYQGQTEDMYKYMEKLWRKVEQIGGINRKTMSWNKLVTFLNEEIPIPSQVEGDVEDNIEDDDAAVGGNNMQESGKKRKRRGPYNTSKKKRMVMSTDGPIMDLVKRVIDWFNEDVVQGPVGDGNGDETEEEEGEAS